MNRITPRQTELLTILARLLKNGVTPTFEEIAKEAGITRSGAFDQFHALRDKGYVIWQRGRARTLRIVRMP